MVVMNSGISWCSGTLNAWVGCDPVSKGCDFCYAKALVDRLLQNFGHAFEDVKLHLHRLSQVDKMRPHRAADGTLSPYLCFVNSMSDFWHKDVPDNAIEKALEVFVEHPDTVFQILTKRPARMRERLAHHFANGIPSHIWIGVSIEDNEVAARANFLRRLKDQVGDFTAFLSVEPIVGPTDQIDFTGIDWVITGGESGPKARIMTREQLLPAVLGAKAAGCAVWHKQNGQIRSHPNLSEAPKKFGVMQQFAWLIENGWEHLSQEKGGATIDRATFREMPPAYHRLCEKLTPQPALI
jgi:protein gp37